MPEEINALEGKQCSPQFKHTSTYVGFSSLKFHRKEKNEKIKTLIIKMRHW